VGNIRPDELPELPWDPPHRRESLSALYVWSEQQVLGVTDWYLRGKGSKARWSKWLRMGAVVFVVVGAILPVVSLIVGTDDLSGEWGFVALAVGAGVVLLDRGFGFTSSWTRYMTTLGAIERRTRRLQLEWNHELVTLSATPDDESTRHAIELLRDFLDDVGDAVERETKAWAFEFNAQSGELSELMRSLPSNMR
jgi:hypothetical protein